MTLELDQRPTSVFWNPQEVRSFLALGQLLQYKADMVTLCGRALLKIIKREAELRDGKGETCHEQQSAWTWMNLWNIHFSANTEPDQVGLPRFAKGAPTNQKSSPGRRHPTRKGRHPRNGGGASVFKLFCP